jgi:hypothetical protein
MKYSTRFEAVVFLKYSLTDVRYKELVCWLRTTARSTMERQQEKTKKINVHMFKSLPIIYLS